MHRGMVNQSKSTMSKEFGEQEECLSELDEQARKPEEAAVAALRPPDSTQQRCSSCRNVGVAETVVFGGCDGPELGFWLGSKGRRDIRLHDEGDGKAAPRSLRREVRCTGRSGVPGCPQIRIICGGCGASLIHFEGGAK